MSQENQIVASRVSGSSSLLPLPSIDVKVREATLADLPTIDALQKKHTKMVGWMPTATLEGKIKLREILVAEEVSGQSSVVSSESVSPRTTDDEYARWLLHRRGSLL